MFPDRIDKAVAEKNGLYYCARTDKDIAHSYGPVYAELLTPLRETPIRFLELGVAEYGAGDLLSFAEFLPLAEIWGVDVNLGPAMPEVRNHPRIKLIGADAYKAESVQLVDGHFDVVIEDLTHEPPNQLLAHDIWWPLVKPGGIYVIEDVQAWHPVSEEMRRRVGTENVRLYKGDRNQYDDNLIIMTKRA